MPAISRKATEEGKGNAGILGLIGLIGLLAFVGIKAIVKPSGIKLTGPLVIEPHIVPLNEDFPEPVTISASAENPTDKTETREIRLSVGNLVVARQTVTLDPGLQQQVVFPITASAQYGLGIVGTYKITMDGLADYCEVIPWGVSDLRIEGPIIFTLNAPFDPATTPDADIVNEIFPDQDFYINVFCRNYGSVSGNAVVVFTVTNP